MKIAIYSHSIAPSVDGVCRRFTGLIKELLQRGYEVVLFTLEVDPRDVTGCRVYHIKHFYFSTYPSKKMGCPSVENFITICQVLATEKPDILHVTADPLSFFFNLAGLCFGVPVVSSIHTDLQEIISALNVGRIYLISSIAKEATDSLCMDSLATTSESFRQKLLRQGVNCEHVIQTGVDTDVFNLTTHDGTLRQQMCFDDPQGIVALYVGRLSVEKRLRELMALVRDVDHVYLAIVGNGPMAEELSRCHGKENRIYCKPPPEGEYYEHAQLSIFYSSSDLHVSCSTFETLGNTVLEAHACGRPVLVPACQGFVNTVHDGIDGYLYNLGRERESFLDCLRVLCESEEKRMVMGESGRQFVAKNNSIGSVVVDLVSWYERVIGRHSSRQFSIDGYHASGDNLQKLCYVYYSVIFKILVFFVLLGSCVSEGVLMQGHEVLLVVAGYWSGSSALASANDDIGKTNDDNDKRRSFTQYIINIWTRLMVFVAVHWNRLASAQSSRGVTTQVNNFLNRLSKNKKKEKDDNNSSKNKHDDDDEFPSTSAGVHFMSDVERGARKRADSHPRVISSV